ncbi:hypothetical protein D3P08_02180 [Paenibacillus nanensis]|uniref:Uncharacterized protein n=1 Tax=Paenibacillus nanensis TaxID=393251 RepID=A0A3A1VSB4_9BACL|nr:hypothetical protein [Paenibacillus nanensis]RIX60390.1 hypothetical protein D3P08_02180 [Paenibacillus nanensis]
MKLFAVVKSIGRRNRYLERVEIELDAHPGTLRGLIAAIVTRNIKALQNGQSDASLIKYLTNEEIQAQGSAGKVGFGHIYNENPPPTRDSVHAAILAYEDGLYRVFIREEEVTALEERLNIEDGDEIVFMRLTMLAGAMW